MSEKGLINKYNITKSDGMPVDPDAVYFVLRLDKDHAARIAALAYAEATPNGQLGGDIIKLVNELSEQADE